MSRGVCPAGGYLLKTEWKQQDTQGGSHGAGGGDPDRGGLSKQGPLSGARGCAVRGGGLQAGRPVAGVSRLSPKQPMQKLRAEFHRTHAPPCPPPSFPRSGAALPSSQLCMSIAQGSTWTSLHPHLPLPSPVGCPGNPAVSSIILFSLHLLSPEPGSCRCWLPPFILVLFQPCLHIVPTDLLKTHIWSCHRLA